MKKAENKSPCKGFNVAEQQCTRNNKEATDDYFIL